MKTIARQIAPEYQMPHLFHIDNRNDWIWDDEYYEDLAIFPTDNYFGYVSGIIRSVFDILEAGNLADDLDSIERYTQDELEEYCYYHTREDAINGYLPRQCDMPYTRSDILSLCDHVSQYGYRTDRDLHILCYVLTIVTGTRYEWRTIHGTCQGEEADVVYPADRFNKESIDILESEYFNQGSEWCIDDEWHLYCHSWDDNGIRSEIANASGCNPADVEMYKFAGYVRTAEYELV